jgi:hypothetical protein
MRGRYVRAYSRPYERVVRLRRKYGVTWEELVTKYGTSCNICGRTRAGNGKDYRLSVDHDHKTGRIRGLLCSPCNRALGFFEDDPTRMAVAIRYLQQP